MKIGVGVAENGTVGQARDNLTLLEVLARPLEDFLAALFGVAAEAADLRGRHSKLAPVFDCKRLFVQRYVTRTIKADAEAAPH